MTDTTAQIAAKGCQSTGITEELAVKMHDQLGKKLMAIVELESVSRTENSEGKSTVQLRILSVEPATQQIADDHLRNFQRALYYERGVADGQPQLPGDEPEPTVKEVAEARGEALLQRDDAGEVSGLWDGNTADEEPAPDDPAAYEPHDYVDTAHATCGYHDCGQPAAAPIHQQPDTEDAA